MPLRLAILWWSIGALLVAIDMLLSLSPPGDSAPLLPDKLVHFTTYFVLGSWFTSLVARPRQLAALAGVILLGAVLELLQGLTPMRQPEWLDLLANTSGALLALLIVMRLPANIFKTLERHLPGATQ